jgi:hypothetical protein
MKKLILLGTTVAVLASCGGGTEKKAPSEKPTAIKTAEHCVYSFNPEKTTFNWLAYKLTERVGVPGVVDSASVSGVVTSENPQDVFKNASVTLFIPSLDSKDATRDKKVVDIFFGAMTNIESITGKVMSVTGDKTSGTGEIMLGFNEKSNTLPFEYTITDSRLKLTFVVDFNDFGAEKAVAALNKACDERHKGKDGKSILWPDVKITIVSALDKECE